MTGKARLYIGKTLMEPRRKWGKELERGAIVSEFQKRSEIVVFAGPNGSGKSTFTQLLKPPIDYINADKIKKYLKCSDLEAAQLAEKQRESHMELMNEFCFETVLSTERNLKLLERAKKGLFYTLLLYSYGGSHY